MRSIEWRCWRDPSFRPNSVVVLIPRLFPSQEPPSRDAVGFHESPDDALPKSPSYGRKLAFGGYQRHRNGCSAWCLLASAEKTATARPGPSARYNDAVTAVRLVGWFLKDTWDHGKTTPYYNPVTRVGPVSAVRGGRPSLAGRGLGCEPQACSGSATRYEAEMVSFAKSGVQERDANETGQSHLGFDFAPFKASTRLSNASSQTQREVATTRAHELLFPAQQSSAMYNKHSTYVMYKYDIFRVRVLEQ